MRQWAGFDQRAVGQNLAADHPASGYSSLGAIISALIAPFYVSWTRCPFPVSMLLLSNPVAPSRQHSAPVAS
ncbi:hypothetical protein ACNKHO_19260 [Shigella flexneri]